MTKKRVAIIVPGGVGNGFFNQGLPAVVNLIAGLAKTYDITVFSMVPVNEDYSPSGFRIISAPPSRRPLLRYFKLGYRIIKEHYSQTFDLIHGIWGSPSGFLAVWMAKWLDIPSVVSLRGGETASIPEIGYGQLRKPSKRRRLFRTLYAADKVTVLSDFQRDILLQHGFNKEVEVIPTGVDTDLFIPAGANRTPPFNFLHVANLTEVKDQVTLLKAFTLIRTAFDCKLNIIGADYLDGKLHRLCNELGLDDCVTFLGPIKNTELPAYYQSSDVLLHTSLYEGQAVVVMEAAASKVLIGGTNTGMISDMGDMVIAVEPGDFNRLAERVIDTLRDEEEWTSKVEQSYQWALAHDINYTIEAFRTLYGMLIKS